MSRRLFFTGGAATGLSLFAPRTTRATWKEKYAQLPKEERDWYKGQTMNQATWERLKKPSWHSCCEKGDVFHTQFRIVENGTKFGEDSWWYEKDGTWKQVPPDIIHWGQHAPSGQPTLFIYQSTGQELCFYPGKDGQ